MSLDVKFDWVIVTLPHSQILNPKNHHHFGRFPSTHILRILDTPKWVHDLHPHSIETLVLWLFFKECFEYLLIGFQLHRRFHEHVHVVVRYRKIWLQFRPMAHSHPHYFNPGWVNQTHPVTHTNCSLRLLFYCIAIAIELDFIKFHYIFEIEHVSLTRYSNSFFWK